MSADRERGIRGISFYSGIPAIASHDKQTDGERGGVGSVKECEGNFMIYNTGFYGVND